MKYVQVQFAVLPAEQNEIIIAMLADMGFEGFEENEGGLTAFINQIKFDQPLLDLFTNSNNLPYSLSIIEQQNWNATWESSFEPVVINNFAAVRAGFHEPVKGVRYEVIITPKMSFGTGHHATTYLMMEQMSGLDFKEKSVLDFGTGTGVLAILAEKMGATSLLAIDNDEWSIDNARENIVNNKALHIELEKAETISTGRQFDIILANINLNVILHNMQAIHSVCKEGTEVLLSGFLSTDADVIKTALEANGLAFKAMSQQKDWICIKAQLS
jgi:ribosomal protein L11 methyltransferase